MSKILTRSRAVIDNDILKLERKIAINAIELVREIEILHAELAVANN